MDIQDKLIYDPEVAAKRRKTTWGGRRAGAGRKPTLRRPARFTGDLERADLDALETIAEEKSVSVASLVRQAVKAFLKRRGRR